MIQTPNKTHQNGPAFGALMKTVLLFDLDLTIPWKPRQVILKVYSINSFSRIRLQTLQFFFRYRKIAIHSAQKKLDHRNSPIDAQHRRLVLFVCSFFCHLKLRIRVAHYIPTSI